MCGWDLFAAPTYTIIRTANFGGYDLGPTNHHAQCHVSPTSCLVTIHICDQQPPTNRGATMSYDSGVSHLHSVLVSAAFTRKIMSMRNTNSSLSPLNQSSSLDMRYDSVYLTCNKKPARKASQRKGVENRAPPSKAKPPSYLQPRVTWPLTPKLIISCHWPAHHLC